MEIGAADICVDDGIPVARTSAMELENEVEYGD